MEGANERISKFHLHVYWLLTLFQIPTTLMLSPFTMMSIRRVTLSPSTASVVTVTEN